MSLELIFRITLKSDYHIGAGQGRGALIDSALLRDADGVPVIRGTTLTGLLRDGLWRLLQLPPLQKYTTCLGTGSAGEKAIARYCGQYGTETDPDLCPLCHLFGTPRTPKAWRISSARPVEMQQPSSKNIQPEGHVVARVRISPRTRRAEPRKLFSQEDGDGRLTFQFTATWPMSDRGALDEAALLTAAARNVRQLGRSRRRGQGECLFTLARLEGTDAIVPVIGTDGKEDWLTPLLDRFAAHWIDGKPAPRSAPVASLSVADSPSGDAPVRVRLFVRTDEPLLIAKRAEAGNQFESLSIITGQTMRGALAWRAAHHYNLGDRGGETYAVFVSTFLRDDVLFPDLYPAQFEKSTLRPTIPVPQDLLTCKVGGLDHGFWFATEGVPETCDQCRSRALAEVKDFVTLSEYDWSPDALFEHEPKRSSEMHIRIDQKKGRVAEGDLFDYVALDVGQYFVGDIVCIDTAAWERLQALADIEAERPTVLRLGKARRRGYGRVTAWFQVVTDKPDVWVRVPLEERANDKDHELRLTLLTDTVITDHWGRYATGFETGWLSEVLKQEVKVLAAAASTRTVDGFDANLGLPRWRDIALAAGSTVRVKLTQSLDLEHLRKLEQCGIGLRRNEGFGRMAFNHPVYNHCQGIVSGIDWPEVLSLAGTYPDEERRFREQWDEILGEQPWKKCDDERFRAVACWLHANQHRSLEELKAQLISLGEPDKEAVELIGGQDEYGDRYTLKPSGDRLSQHHGIELVSKVLTQLEGFQSQFWPLGVQMLAEQVASVVAQQEAEG